MMLLLNTFINISKAHIFILARDTEKLKQKEAKKQAKKLKIWEKNTAASRAPLKRYKDDDIPPSVALKDIFYSKEREVIDKAKSICQQRVQYPKESKTLSSYDFIDQK